MVEYSFGNHQPVPIHTAVSAIATYNHLEIIIHGVFHGLIIVISCQMMVWLYNNWSIANSQLWINKHDDGYLVN